MSQIHIYALFSDLEPVFESLEKELSIKYAEFCHSKNKDGVVYSTYRAISDLSKYQIPEKQYLILREEAKLNARWIDGPNLYAFDQLLNPDSVVIRTGGYVDEMMILSGDIGSCTTKESETSKKILKLIQKQIKKNFKKVRAYWVGPAAYDVLTIGGRLTLSKQTPKEFDLKLED